MSCTGVGGGRRIPGSSFGMRGMEREKREVVLNEMKWWYALKSKEDLNRYWLSALAVKFMIAF